MGKPRIALFVATPLRDLPGIVLTAFELCRRGAVCYIVPQVSGFEEIWALAPDFVLLPAFRPYYAPRAVKYDQVGIRFGLLDTEQTVYASIAGYRNTLWGDPALSARALCVCMWGPRLANALITDGIFTREQVDVTGCPRFDFYRDPLAQIYRESDATPRDGRPSVLINTNFTTANYSDLPYDILVRNLVQNYGYTAEQVHGWRNQELIALDAMTDLARRIATDFPGIDVILRPHPQERSETYRERVGAISNLAISKVGPVVPWILRASAVIQRSCTTAIEASLAEVPSLSPAWIEVAHVYPLPEAVSVQCQDYGQLAATLQEILESRYELPPEVEQRRGRMIDEWFYRTDGQAHCRVADAILKRLDSPGRIDRAQCLKYLYGLHHEGTGTPRRLANLGRYALSLPVKWSFRTLDQVQSKDAGFCAENVRELADSIAHRKPQPTSKPVRVTDATESGAYITSKYRGRAVMMESF